MALAWRSVFEEALYSGIASGLRIINVTQIGRHYLRINLAALNLKSTTNFRNLYDVLFSSKILAVL